MGVAVLVVEGEGFGMDTSYQDRTVAAGVVFAVNGVVLLNLFNGTRLSGSGENGPTAIEEDNVLISVRGVLLTVRVGVGVEVENLCIVDLVDGGV